MLTNDATNSDVKITMQLIPTINMNWKGQEILNLNVSLEGELTEGTQCLDTKIIGDAYLQIVNQEWVSVPLIDYIESKLIDFPRELRYSQPLHLMSYTDRIKCQYACLNEALICMDFGQSEIKGTIAVIQMIRIYPQFRKKGLAKAYMWLILKALKENLNVDYVLLQAYPVEIKRDDKKAFEKEKSHLEKIYTKSGFKKRSKVIKENDGFNTSYMFQKISGRAFDTYRV